MDYKIRKYEQKDADALCVLMFRSIREIASKDYTPEQIKVWAARVPPASWMEMIGTDGRVRLVAVDKFDEPVGFVDLETSGHIAYIYCAPEAVGSSVGSSLYEAIETSAREMGLTKLYVEASEPAQRLFLKHGFVVDHRREFKIEGVTVHNYAMEKKLHI